VDRGARAARALLEIQRQTSEAHAAYLRLAEKSMEALSSVADPHRSGPTTHGAVAKAPEDSWNDVQRAAVPTPGLPHLPVPDAPLPRTSAGPPVRSPGPGADLAELEAAVLAVVSEKTGYPLELLGPHLELEADLGLDSITKVQILASLRHVFPQLETIDRSRLARLAGLNTVGDVAAHLRELFTDGALPAAAGSATALPVEARVHRQRPVMVAAPPPGRPIAGLGPGVLVVTDERSGLAHQVVALLGERGVPAEVRTEVPADAAGVLFLGGMAEVASADEAFAVQREAFRAARAVAPRMTRTGGVFVTVQDTGGDFGLRDPDPCRSWLGGLAGLARTAAAEWPAASVKAIDCARGNRDTAEVARALLDELLTGGDTLDVGLAADGTRRTQQFTEADPLVLTPPDLGDKPVILVTGGARGITAAALTDFARSCPARFVLIGRSAPDGPHAAEIRATTAVLEESGSLVRYVSTDIRDRDRLRRVLEEVRTEWGPVTGLVHGAGVLADRLIADKTAEQFDEVFGTKAEGLASLLAETEADPLRLLCVFSSVVGSFGNTGQCDYAMANETLNHVIAAQRAERPDALVRALIWGPWQGGMVTPKLGEIFRMGGVPLLPVAAGASAFTAELGSDAPEPRVMISAGPAASFFGRDSR
jgi:NAD(P)-dependent dehydrogenase (short-subunit alcohol dehydrogenase family)